MTTREQIIAAAKEVGAYRYINRAAKDEPTHTFTVEQLEAFYSIAFDDGREECAKIIEAQDVDPAFKHRMAFAIRSRSTK